MKPSPIYPVKMFAVLILMLFPTALVIKGQALLKNTSPASATPFIESNGNLAFGNGNFGIGISPDSVRLHVRTTGSFSGQPLFKTELWNTYTGEVASIKNLVRINSKNYGIYQTNFTAGALLNYFQDQVKSGNILFGNGAVNTTIFSLDSNVTRLDVNFNPGNPSPAKLTPLSVYASSIRVRSNLVTDNFQMINGAGAYKVLTSDSAGNASWQSTFGQSLVPWTINQSMDIVSNSGCHNVGIGTTNPTQNLEISHSDIQGGISIDQLSRDPIGSEIVFKKDSRPQFAIGHNFNEDRSCFFLWSHLEERTELFMDLNNGMMGIGTEWPNARLDVSGDFKATAVGIGTDPPSDTSSYKLFVEGGIKARKVKVTIDNFPDYCF
ncbi:MAG: hypothetical protein NTW16_07440, partial [Bacteroidetes bacterium]|nr:hypothetical protein [Bacteroidota bacterium]